MFTWILLYFKVTFFNGIKVLLRSILLLRFKKVETRWADFFIGEKKTKRQLIVIFIGIIVMSLLDL